MDPSTDGKRFAEAALGAIRDAISPRELYVALYGAEPSRQELQAFRNRLNPARSNPGADFLGRCVESVPELRSMTLSEFFALS